MVRPRRSACPSTFVVRPIHIRSRAPPRRWRSVRLFGRSETGTLTWPSRGGQRLCSTTGPSPLGRPWALSPSCTRMGRKHLAVHSTRDARVSFSERAPSPSFSKARSEPRREEPSRSPRSWGSALRATRTSSPSRPWAVRSVPFGKLWKTRISLRTLWVTSMPTRPALQPVTPWRLRRSNGCSGQRLRISPSVRPSRRMDIWSVHPARSNVPSRPLRFGSAGFRPRPI